MLQFNTCINEATKEADAPTDTARQSIFGTSAATRRRHSTMRSNYAAKLASTPEADDDEIERMDDWASHASSGTSMFGGQKAEHIVAARSMRVELAAEIKRFIAFFDQAVKTGDASDHGDADDIRSVVVKMAQEFVAFVQATFPTDSGEDF